MQAIVSGKVFGLILSGLTCHSKKEYKINSIWVPVRCKVIDEKLEKEELESDKQFSQKNQHSSNGWRTARKSPTKNWSNWTKEYEKAERENKKNLTLISESHFRLIPWLTKRFALFGRLYGLLLWIKKKCVVIKKTDSISEVQRKRDEGDTLKSKRKHKGFNPLTF